MKHSIRSSFLLSGFQRASRLGAAALLLGLPAVAQGTLYRVNPANTPAGTLLSQGSAIDADGELAGIAATPTAPNGVGFLDEVSGLRLLTPLPGHDVTQPFRFFRNGRVVGFSTDTTIPETRAVVWAPGAMLLPLRLLPGYTSSFATSSNGRSEIVGWCTDPVTPSTVPVLWRHGVLERLPLPPGMTDGQAAAINDLGRIVGFVSGGGGPPTAFVMERNGQPQLVQPLPGGILSQLVHVNQAGAAVGAADVMGSLHAVRWENGVLTDLGVAAGTTDAFLFTINRTGQAVGVAITQTGGFAVVTVGDQLVDLSTVLEPGSAGWQLLLATDINNAGQIAATAMTSTGDLVAVVLDPVSTPPGAQSAAAPPSQRPLSEQAHRVVEESLRLRFGPLALHR